ncbi:MAG: hypothetical protein KA146_02300 [Leptospiraceae bacterium]|nr:hypothetical protein [Leptospiraceae bacterium]
MNNFDFTDLILLVGTNPLPNYVVGAFFLDELKKGNFKKNSPLERIWLVRTEENEFGQASTKIQADNLKDILIKGFDSTTQRIEFPPFITLTDAGSSRKIKEEINKQLLPKLSNKKVHLNYTGGTKAMGIHVYIALKESNVLVDDCSYLDGRRFKILSDTKDYFYNEKDLRETVSIDFENITKLHGYTESKDKGSKKEFESAVEKFSEFVNTDKIEHYYKCPPEFNELNLFYNPDEYVKLKVECRKQSEDNESNCEHKFKYSEEAIGYCRKLFLQKDRESLIEKVKDLQIEKLLKYKYNEEYLAILNLIPDDYSIYKNGIFRKPISNDNLKDTIKFLDGEWLEEYIYDSMKQQIENTFHNTKVFLDCEVNKPYQAQVDLVVLRGFQFIGVSCTTDTRNYIAKSKGFEIIHRSRQLGGDESKSVLITRLNENECSKLQESLEQDIGASAKEILVLGKDDLKEKILLKKIIKFINDDRDLMQ